MDVNSNTSVGDGVTAVEKEVAGSEKPSDDSDGENLKDNPGEKVEVAIEDDGTPKPTSQGTDTSRAKKEEGKDESVSSNIKKICHDKNIFKKDGFLDPNSLYQAFIDGLLDVEDFKSALK